MSKSLARVRAALTAAGVHAEIREMDAETRTAEQAAAAAGCAIDQIAKSMIFRGESGQLFLFITAGGRRVDEARARDLAGEVLGRADPDEVRATTGFAIGGVAPLGLARPLPTFLDRHLLGFERIWAAAGTPRHIFAITPTRLEALSGAVAADFAR